DERDAVGVCVDREIGVGHFVFTSACGFAAGARPLSSPRISADMACASVSFSFYRPDCTPVLSPSDLCWLSFQLPSRRSTFMRRPTMARVVDWMYFSGA